MRKPTAVMLPECYWPEPRKLSELPYTASKPGQPGLQRLLSITAVMLKVDTDYLKAQKGRDRARARARFVYFWLARRYTNHSFPKIASFVGIKDHTSVYHGILSIIAWRPLDPTLDTLLSRVEYYLQCQFPDAEPREFPAMYFTKAMRRYSSPRHSLYIKGKR